MHCSDLPGSTFGTDVNTPLFGLAPDGVYPAIAVTSNAVRSYRTISPLPWPDTLASRNWYIHTMAVYFLWHWPSAHAAQVLPGSLPCEARTFLPCYQVATAIVWLTPGKEVTRFAGFMQTIFNALFIGALYAFTT